MKKPDAEREGPERRCIVSGESGGKDGLIRFVLDPEGQVVPDLAEKLPGRGLWVTAVREMVEKAALKGHFAKAAKAPAKAGPELADLVERLLARRAADALGLARKAGALETGFEKVLTAIERGRIAALIEARDGAQDGRRKLEQRLRVVKEQGILGDVPVLSPLWADEMGLALGRGNVIHAALIPGRMQAKVVADLARLARYGRKLRPENARVI
ncbi:RNA-binding protein [Parvibaculum sp.]|uniref:RNA-binding protein n=1 Tax=Parvibaculum sp. TaxID=2024848 RepID=UPI001B1060EA|nr:RNA-binding protein [Parvibaculum sp.]MBO6634344.1 RNA-binding protein [Parvibaculum sp.]MBO6677560.1 RNA-binding protein [Parvibaculum sp.]MBO6685353.1 RNA-binding protein [Parvibaculum sp.]MBO6905221.1 RNA-binding protein [Parvibaculum sp.]